jgi:hypothetical protein
MALMGKQFSLTLFAFLVIFNTNSALAYCSAPQPPSCYTSMGLVTGRPNFNSCRSEIEGYQRNGQIYVQCLANEVNEAARTANLAYQTRQGINQATRHYDLKVMEYEHKSNAFTADLNNVIYYFNCYAGGGVSC